MLFAPQLLAAGVVIVLSDSAPAYQAFAQSLRTEIEGRSHVEVQILSLDAALHSHANLRDSVLHVAVGSLAAEELVSKAGHAPLLLAMQTRANVVRLTGLIPNLGAVYIDQPPARYIALLRAALPEANRIGLLSGRDSKETVARLNSAAREARVRAHIEAIATESDIYPAMQRLFVESDVLLATPDTSIYNAQTLPSILLGAYRRGIPTVGFSPAYVTAGAVIALYSTPEQLAAQSADICLQVLAGANMPAPQYPRHYTIGINERVARSLGLSLEGEIQIRDRLEKLERQQ